MIIKAWIAMNRGEFDPNNMSFSLSKKEIMHDWGDQHQVIIPCKIVIEPKHADWQKEKNVRK